MNEQDGEILVKSVEEFINTELKVGNTITKYNGSAFGADIGGKINEIIQRDIDKEKLWNECGEKWLAEQKLKEKDSKKNMKNLIDAKKTIKENLLNNKLKT